MLNLQEHSRRAIRLDRTTFIALAGGLALLGPRAAALAKSSVAAMTTTLLTAPLDVAGDWGGSAPNDARAVVACMREACLADVRLVSDRQPQRLRVDDHRSGPPHVWLHSDHPDTAWVVVDIGARDWCRLSYQFGHELGHVLCNSWAWGDGPKPPTQWLEEAMVEAFSLRGLGLLADRWERQPPFPHDQAFAGAIRQYRANALNGYQDAAPKDAAAWLRAGMPPAPAGSNAPEGPPVAPVLAELERDKRCVEDMGAVNRWPERSGLPVTEYLAAWQKSCAEIAAPGVFPARLKSVFGLA